MMERFPHLACTVQEIALVEPDAWHPLPGAQHSAPAAGSGPGGTAPGSELPAPQQQPAEQQQPPPQQEPSPTGSGAEADGLPRLRVATKRPDGGGAAAAGPSRGPPDPTHCVLLRAGGVMSLLNMDQGTGRKGAMRAHSLPRCWAAPVPASAYCYLGASSRAQWGQAPRRMLPLLSTLRVPSPFPTKQSKSCRMRSSASGFQPLHTPQPTCSMWSSPQAARPPQQRRRRPRSRRPARTRGSAARPPARRFRGRARSRWGRARRQARRGRR